VGKALFSATSADSLIYARAHNLADPEIWKNKGGGKTMCQTCGHVSQMHTKNYAFYTKKKRLFEKNLSQ